MRPNTAGREVRYTLTLPLWAAGIRRTPPRLIAHMQRQRTDFPPGGPRQYPAGDCVLFQQRFYADSATGCEPERDSPSIQVLSCAGSVGGEQE